ncbi:MAG: hypothetical protein ACD_20C00344G0003 [uncultured bacterium]|nr:MAG: hypothetical protein ACD_20C00344G0003 [uncultured bacterium]
MLNSVNFGYFTPNVYFKGLRLQRDLQQKRAAFSPNLDKDIFLSTINQKAIPFLGEKHISIKAAWKDPSVREKIEQSVLKGNFKDCPKLGKAFLRKIEVLCSSRLSDDQVYKELRDYLDKVRPQVNNIWGVDDKARFSRRAAQIKEIIGVDKVASFTDVGCGDGKVTLEIADALKLNKGKLTGLEVYVRQDETYPFDIKEFDGVKIPLPDKSQDLVTLFAVLHHAKNPEGLLKEIHRILTPNGKLVIRELDAEDQSSKLFNFVMDEMWYKVYTPYDGVPIREDGYHSSKEWSKMLKESGLQVEKTMKVEPKNPYKPFMVLSKKGNVSFASNTIKKSSLELVA